MGKPLKHMTVPYQISIKAILQPRKLYFDIETHYFLSGLYLRAKILKFLLQSTKGTFGFAPSHLPHLHAKPKEPFPPDN
jgi:hypothetical protein